MTFEKYEKFAIFIAKVLELVFQVAVINTSTQVCVCMFRVCELKHQFILSNLCDWSRLISQTKAAIENKVKYPGLNLAEGITTASTISWPP